jgi:hypothetical protein
MDEVVCPMDVVAITATVGNCEAVCLVVIEELRCGTVVESELTLMEMRQSSTKVKVRLALVSIGGGFLHLDGRCQAQASLVVDGLEIQPLNHSAQNGTGIMFDLGELKALAESKKAGSTGSRCFKGDPQHEALVLEGSRGRVEAMAAKLMQTCRFCPFSCLTVAMRQHSGGHILHGITEGGSGGGGGDRNCTSMCGFCGGVISEGRCSTTISNLEKAATSKFISNCPMYPGEQVTTIFIFFLCLCFCVYTFGPPYHRPV